MPRHSTAFAALMVLAGCTTVPTDPVTVRLDAGESLVLRVPGILLHDHDMQERSYNSPQGYEPIVSFEGQLAVTDRRMLFVAAGDIWVSIPFAAISRARPSQTPLLNYVVIWDSAGHADSFIVDAHDVKALHRAVGEAMLRHPSGAAQLTPGTHSIGSSAQ